MGNKTQALFVKKIFDLVYVNATALGLVIIQRRNCYHTRETLVTRGPVELKKKTNVALNKQLGPPIVLVFGTCTQ